MRFLLFPFSLLFRIIVYIRNKFYRFDLFKTVKLGSKVISVGNISTGGTGKTPLVEYLARRLINKNKFVVILTRGYKRIYDDIKVIELGYGDPDHKLGIDELGDESLMLLDNFRDLEPGKGLLVVSDNKTTGAKLASSKFKPDLLIIDDGFQHRTLLRDLDIVMLDRNTRGMLLPAGNLREPRSSLSRADIIVHNRKFYPHVENPRKKWKYNEIECEYAFEDFINIKDEKLEIKNAAAMAFCAIGDPDSFKKLLEQLHMSITHFIKFPDHHEFSDKDVNSIIELHRLEPDSVILTTQKDFIRIKYSQQVLHSAENSSNVSKDLLCNYPLFYAKIKLQFPIDAEILTDRLNALIN
jgi:tetraacyldisaccharide 4'-kinase